jgi:hypothetical protein
LCIGPLHICRSSQKGNCEIGELIAEQIPAYTDRWMMGDRYGAVVKIIKRIVGDRVRVVAHVKLDKSGKTVRVILFDFTEI